MQQHSALITVMLASVRKASKRILRDFHELRFLQSSKRPLGKFLKFAVSKAEETIFESLHQARPEFGIISKYSDYEEDSSLSTCWIVNALDGIENFSHAIPYFSISIAVKQKKEDGSEEIIAGMIYVPALSELYFADKGNGAWCQFSEEFRAGVSETRLRISGKSQGQPVVFTNDIQFNELGSSVRMLGSNAISLVYLASGRGDKCILQYDDLSDIAAGIIIAKEAGGIVENDSKAKKLVVRRI
jgi:myo-inositol-1(or 4)-monophosphatase